MTKKKGPKIPGDLWIWIEARERHGLTHTQVQMARELGMNPKTLDKLDSQQQAWKEPLPQYIESLFRKRFRKDSPDIVMSMEDRAALLKAKKEERRERKAAEKAAEKKHPT